jgi:hypothetical protein
MSHPQTPGFWSPDDTQVVVYGLTRDSETGIFLLLTTSGGLTPLSVPGRPLGWLDDDRLAWLTRDGRSFLVTDTEGRELQRVDLPVRLRGLDQWSGRLSPDGSRVAVLQGERLSIYSMTTGERLREGTSSAMPRIPVSTPMWHGDEVWVWDGNGYVDTLSGARTISVSSRWGSTAFAHWAADSIDGPARSGPSVFDVRYWPFLWWRKQALVAFVVVLIVGVWWFDRRDRITLRRRRATPDAPSEPSSD